MDTSNYISSVDSSNLYNSNTIENESDSTLGIDDFLKLLAAQLSNQDMMSDDSNTEFIAQLAQFSSVQAMDNMSKIAGMTQSTDLIGKTITVAKNLSTGQVYVDKGVVDKVVIDGDTSIIYVNGEEYSYSDVQSIEDTSTDVSLKDLTSIIGNTVVMDNEYGTEGEVEKIIMDGGTPKLVVDGDKYEYSDIYEILGIKTETSDTLGDSTGE